jgi:cytochrome c553
MAAVVQDVSVKDSEDLAAHFSGLKCESSLDAEKAPASAAPATVSTCIGCHGAGGISTNRAVPNLVGQTKDYLVAALGAYKDGTRKNVMMTGIVKDLSDASAESAAAYYANASCKRD